MGSLRSFTRLPCGMALSDLNAEGRERIRATRGFQGAAIGAHTLAQAKDQLARLVDEALNGLVVKIEIDGRPVVTLAATPSEPLPITPDHLDGLRQRRASRPSLGGDSVTLVREMPDEEPAILKGRRAPLPLAGEGLG